METLRWPGSFVISKKKPETNPKQLQFVIASCREKTLIALLIQNDQQCLHDTRKFDPDMTQLFVLNCRVLVYSSITSLVASPLAKSVQIVYSYLLS